MKVVFATPVLSHWVSVEHHVSAMETAQLLRSMGIENSFKYLGGDPYLARVRNNLVAMALHDHPDMTDFMFLDDDLGWKSTDLLRLLEHPGDFVAGVYPKKNDLLEFPCQLELVDGRLVETGGWLKARAVPTGFMRLKRSVIDKFCEASHVYNDDDGQRGSHQVWNMFQMGYSEESGHWWGEDYAFCEQWARMGGDIWVYPDIDFTHRGSKKWAANFSLTVEAFKRQQEDEAVKEAAE